MNTLYEKLASEIEAQIKSGVLKVGDKLPSLRNLHKSTGYSISTIVQAMYLLESKGLIHAKPKSGYFVSYKPISTQLIISALSKPSIEEAAEIDIEDLIQKVYGQKSIWNNDRVPVNFAFGVPAPEMLPVQKLKKVIAEVSRGTIGIQYEPVMGNENLRRQVAKRTLLWEKSLVSDDLITTNGCLNALSYALMALTQRGDTILVESPVYFGTLQLAKSLGLNVLEMPTHSQTGIDLDAVLNAIRHEKIAACIVVSNFSNPMGYCMPDEHKRLLVKICTEYQVPLIEEDLYADVYFGKERPISCKSLDEDGIVLWCNSVSKTLSSGFRVGWIAPGKFKDRVLKTKFYHDVSATSISHEIVAQFMDKGRYEHQLQRLRIELNRNLGQWLQTIQEHFPKDTKTTHPEGSFMLWLELNPLLNTGNYYDEALKQGIQYAPGRLFTLRNQFHNYLRLSYGLRWDRHVELALIKLGRLFTEKLRKGY